MVNDVQQFINRWNYVRSETLEILSKLAQTQMSFKPEGQKWQPMYAHFSCIAKTQRVYTKAIDVGTMDFAFFHTLELPDKSKFGDKKFAEDYLAESNRLWLSAIHNSKGIIIWDKQLKVILTNHIARLAEHERLHHGQLVSYFTLANIELPTNFKANWAL